MFLRSPRLSRRALVFSAAAGALTISAAGAATYHSLSVTTTTGSEGASTFLQNSATSSALQGEVASTPQKALKIPFGVLGEYDAAGSTFGIGVAGISTTGYGVAGESFSGEASVLALSGASAPAIEADLPTSSSAHYAIFANGANGGDGGYFTSAAGTGLDSEATDNTNDNSGQGVYASNQSTEASAIAANNYSATPPPSLDAGGGVYASAQGPGLFTESYGDPGLATQFDCDSYATSQGEDGGLGGTTCAGVYVVNTGKSGYPFLYYSAADSDFPVYIDADGNAGFTGTVTMGDAVSRNSNTDEMTYTSKQTEKTVEDFGTAQLQNGAANVPLRADFTATIDTRRSYMVFLTPHGDNRGLYVATTTPAGFTVRESQSGRSTLAFDYRIVARPAGSVAERLPRFHQRSQAFPRADRATRYVAHRNGAKLNRRAQMRKPLVVPASIFKLNLNR